MEKWTFYIFVAGLGLLLRSIVSLHPHSGQNRPPMYGDYEAQRHWQEITVNLKPRNWYRNTTKNDLNYWGLDYPPLTAYHSWVMGKVAKAIDPSFVKLQQSRGISNDSHKLFMRSTVLAVDAMIYLPALLAVCGAIYDKFMDPESGLNVSYLQLVLAVAYPGQILIDNGHFQYNNVSLGLMMFAVAALLYDKYFLGTLFFTLAINYKQMELYHALPFFFYLLGVTFQKPFKEAVFHFVKISATVLITTAAIWAPWLKTMKSTLQVVGRLFPIYRGVFEDKVASVWCIVNVPVKLRKYLSDEQMAVVCLTCTAAVTIPLGVHLMLNPKKKTFLYCLLNTSLAFFLFSFHVHEKSILLAVIPALLLFPFEPFACYWFLQTATYSMLTLYLKDGLLLAYIALQLTYFLVVKIVAALISGQKALVVVDVLNVGLLIDLYNEKTTDTRGKRTAFYLSVYFSLILIICESHVLPPKNLPHIFPLLTAAYSCLHFVFFLIYFSYKQLTTVSTD